MISRTPFVAVTALLCVVTAGCASSTTLSNEKEASATVEKVTLPSEVIDLSYWKITVPTDTDNDGKSDEVKIPKISSYYHPDYFYVNDKKEVVFTSPNKATTSPNSSNTRSELRHSLRGSNKRIDSKAYGNHFSLKSHPRAKQFAAVGGKLETTLSVNHVSVNAGHSEKAPAYSAVVGQIHANKDKKEYLIPGYGYGNEPIKIYYKKFPNHETGSVFWTYERNLAKKDPNRRDIAYPVWGYTWENATNPGSKGIALNEEFSYTINVYENIMYLTFVSAKQGTVKYEIDLSNNVDAYGNVDPKDNPGGYAGDQLYFKAGIYNQCSTKDQEGFWYTACPGKGIWSEDKANGNYAQSTFSKIELSPAEAPE